MLARLTSGVSTNPRSGRPRREASSRGGVPARRQALPPPLTGVPGTEHHVPIRMRFAGWYGESKELGETGVSLLGPPQPGRCAPQLAVPTSCSSRSFPEMPVDKPMESTLQLSRHQPHSSPPEIFICGQSGLCSMRRCNMCGKYYYSKIASFN